MPKFILLLILCCWLHSTALAQTSSPKTEPKKIPLFPVSDPEWLTRHSVETREYNDIGLFTIESRTHFNGLGQRVGPNKIRVLVNIPVPFIQKLGVTGVSLGGPRRPPRPIGQPKQNGRDIVLGGQALFTWGQKQSPTNPHKRYGDFTKE